MLTNTLDILVFSKDCDFSDETNDILIASKIKYNIRFAETQRELADFLKYLLKPKLIIYDSLYGGTETYDMLAKKIEQNDTLSCIFIHERSDKKLTCGLDRVISLERPFGRDAYIEALSRICFKNSGGFSDIQESGDAHDRIRSEVNIAGFSPVVTDRRSRAHGRVSLSRHRDSARGIQPSAASPDYEVAV